MKYTSHILWDWVLHGTISKMRRETDFLPFCLTVFHSPSVYKYCHWQQKLGYHWQQLWKASILFLSLYFCAQFDLKSGKWFHLLRGCVSAIFLALVDRSTHIRPVQNHKLSDFEMSTSLWCKCYICSSAD